MCIRNFHRSFRQQFSDVRLVATNGVRHANIDPHCMQSACSVPATGCDVERSFSSLKRVKDERQKGMHKDTHIAAALLLLNGVVPAE